MTNIKYDFNDVLIQPSEVTYISSRNEINPFYSNGFLPLMTAPMDTVINSENQHIFVDNNIIPCQPRGIEAGPDGFTSYSLVDFVEKFITNGKVNVISKILIDMANGHMISLIETVRIAKEMYGDEMILMVGNVAHPKTYALLSDAGADYIRVGIGNGGGCLTTQQLGIGYPMGSLIKECYEISLTLNTPAKIVADGGMKDYSDIIKALALGADYVMLGSILNKSLESASKPYEKHDNNYVEISLEIAKDKFNRNKEIFKNFRGMSTKEVQASWGSTKLKTSEGIIKFQKVEYTIAGWVENFESYLRSAMSYTGSLSLNEFCGEVNTIMITQNSFARFNK